MKCIKLPAEVSIYAVTELKQKIEPYLSNNQEIELDFEQVETLDTAGVQLLIWLHKRSTHDNQPLKLTHINEQILSVLEYVGVKEMLCIPEELTHE
ncbi:STAS domain-containing protein [Teredinibacter sp. KSP-S5-2]|uniref:STAS domain-containing protein n=1 Tax=Teredinibacter sp. KSP-S5-2 TaxID=3034506 RepID=UPI002934BA11|nr:STAS domain-containing protein [Teredinibacter sp. KSP-S5-2]WNO08161.1 STAS domain-containing protein [Teredinibacter sp. KSP-S5-2]